VFACAGCGLPAFHLAMKFDSGTGWPSFFTTIPGVFGTTVDRKLFMERTEYHCVRCGGHHGHIFDDGPEPTGLRYCNNGVALRFIPRRAKPRSGKKRSRGFPRLRLFRLIRTGLVPNFPYRSALSVRCAFHIYRPAAA